MSKKQLMELNGVVNIKLLIEENGGELDIYDPTSVREVVEKIEVQLDLLERYMLAYNKAIRNGTQTPYWHEVRANPKAYPLNRES